MPSDAPTPIPPPRRKSASARFATQALLIWWVGALLPTITVGLELVGVLKIAQFPLLTPVNTLIASVLVCTAASYSQRRDITAILMDLLWVMFLSLIQVTLIVRLAARLAGAPSLFF